MFYYKLNSSDSLFEIRLSAPLGNEVYIYGPQRIGRGSKHNIMPDPPLELSLYSPSQIYDTFTKLKFRYPLQQIISYEKLEEIL